MAKLDAIGTSIQEVTGSLGQGLSGDRVGALLTSVQATSEQIRLLVMENRAAIRGTMANAESASATLARELPRLADEMARAVTEIGQHGLREPPGRRRHHRQRARADGEAADLGGQPEHHHDQDRERARARSASS
jgi:hypothetical protein